MSDQISVEELMKSQGKKKGSDRVQEIMDSLDDDDESSAGDLFPSSKEMLSMPKFSEILDVPEALIFTALLVGSMYWIKDENISRVTGDKLVPLGRSGIVVALYLVARIINKTDILKKL